MWLSDWYDMSSILLKAWLMYWVTVTRREHTWGSLCKNKVIFLHQDKLDRKILLKHNILKQGHNIVNKGFILKSFDTF